MRLLISSCLLVPFLLFARSNADEPKGKELPQWRPLFDGKSLDGWEHVGPGKMVVESGVIRTEGGMGLLVVHPREIWRLRPPGRLQDDASVIRTPVSTSASPTSPKDAWYAVHNGYEVQICDVQDEYHGTGSIYSLSKMTARPAKPAGEWNTMEITLKGRRILVAINGVRVNDLDPDTANIPERKQGVRAQARTTP